MACAALTLFAQAPDAPGLHRDWVVTWQFLQPFRIAGDGPVKPGYAVLGTDGMFARAPELKRWRFQPLAIDSASRWSFSWRSCPPASRNLQAMFWEPGRWWRPGRLPESGPPTPARRLYIS